MEENTWYERLVDFLLNEIAVASKFSAGFRLLKKKLRKEKKLNVIFRKILSIYFYIIWRSLKNVLNYLNPFFWMRYWLYRYEMYQLEEKMSAFRLFAWALEESKNEKYYSKEPSNTYKNLKDLSYLDIVHEYNIDYWLKFTKYVYEFALYTEKGDDIEAAVYFYAKDIKNVTMADCQHIYMIIRSFLKPTTINYYIHMYIYELIYNLHDLSQLGVHLKNQIPLENMSDIELFYSRYWVLYTEYDFYVNSKYIVNHMIKRYGLTWVLAGKFDIREYYKKTRQYTRLAQLPKPDEEILYYSDPIFRLYSFVITIRGESLEIRRRFIDFYYLWLEPDVNKFILNNSNFLFFYIYISPYIFAFLAFLI